MKREFWVAAILVLLIGLAVLFVARWVDRPNPVVSEQVRGHSQTSGEAGGAPFQDAGEVDRAKQVDGLRVRVSPAIRTFTVLQAPTRQPVSAALVCVGEVGGGRRFLGKTTGVTDGHGRLVCEADLPGGSSFFAVVRGVATPFEVVPEAKLGEFAYLALVEPVEVARFEVVDEVGRPIEGAAVVVSRKPLDVALQIDWTASPAAASQWVAGSRIDAETVVWTGKDGFAEVGVSRPCRLFWAISKCGYVPWGNSEDLVLQAPGAHRIILRRIVAAALRVEGDEVVTESHDGVRGISNGQWRHFAAVQEYLRKKLGAHVVCVAPKTPESDRGSLVSHLFLRCAGRREVVVPMRDVTDGFAAHVERFDRAPNEARASGVIRLDLRAADDRDAAGLRWTVAPVSGRGSKSGMGSAEVELPPGDYRVFFQSPAVASSAGPFATRVGADTTSVIEYRVPRELVEVEVVIELGGVRIDGPGRRQIVVERDGVACDGLDVGAGQRQSFWLLPGRYLVRGWMGGYQVDQSTIDLGPGAGPVLVSLSARDL